MRLWTIQPERVYREIRQDGRYVCDPAQIAIPALLPAYDWLVSEMTARIGAPPEGVTCPVWAWYRQNAKHRRPDLRQMRRTSGQNGEKMVCLTLEVPEAQVVLSDFDAWGLILNGAFITESEEEDRQLGQMADSLPPDERSAMKKANWQRVFDISPFESDWTRRGAWVQATFWVLTKEMITDVKY